jgi:hypothetical protein
VFSLKNVDIPVRRLLYNTHEIYMNTHEYT